MDELVSFALLFESHQVSHQVMNVIVRVLRKQVDVGFGGVVHLDLYFGGGPRAVAAGSVAKSYREFIQVNAGAADGLSGSQDHSHFGFGPARIHQALEEPESNIAGSHTGKVT